MFWFFFFFEKNVANFWKSTQCHIVIKLGLHYFSQSVFVIPYVCVCVSVRARAFFPVVYYLAVFGLSVCAYYILLFEIFYLQNSRFFFFGKSSQLPYSLLHYLSFLAFFFFITLISLKLFFSISYFSFSLFRFPPIFSVY